MKKTCILAILDGWGIGKKDDSNPIYMANTPTIEFIEKYFPSGTLQASGIAVGLSWDMPSTSEVGHLTIGAGKTIYQKYPKITLAIQNKSFFENKILKKSFTDAKEKGKNVHLVGLFSNEANYASKEHCFALLEMAKRENIENIFLHLFLDAKNNHNEKSARELVQELQKNLNEKKIGKIASISGAYYAMGKDLNIKNTELVFEVIAGDKIVEKSNDINNLFDRAEEKKASGYFLFPTFIEGGERIHPEDSVIFWNFEEQGLNSLITKITDNVRKKNSTFTIITLSDYENKNTIPVFEEEIINKTLGGIISEAGKNQLRITETEKYRNLTFYFNGMRENPYQNEYRIKIPSQNDLNQVTHPEMMAETITNRALLALNDGGFDFIVITYANPDIMASTGDFKATVQAIEIIDKELEKLVKATINENHTLVIVGSHGNAELLLKLETGEIDRNNNPNSVPFYLVGEQFRKKNPLRFEKLSPLGILSDVAPTILEIMKISKPKEMAGESLLPQLSYQKNND